MTGEINAWTSSGKRPWLIKCRGGREFIVYETDPDNARSIFERLVAESSTDYPRGDVRDISRSKVESVAPYTRGLGIAYVDNRRTPGA